MGATDNHGSGGRLRVGLIADARGAALMGAALRGCPFLELLGHAGLPQSAALANVPWHDDSRVLLGAPDLQAVLLAGSTRGAVELSRMALQRGLHVWRLPPLARNFAEAAELATAVKRGTSLYRVASWWEHVADGAWAELQWPESFHPVFSELRVAVCGPPADAWTASAAEAAGGALARDACGLLEALNAVRGLPESLTAAVSHCRPGPGGAVRATEDAALALLRYTGDGTALVRVAWDQSPTERLLVHHAAQVSATLTDDGVALSSSDGAPIDHRPAPGGFLATELARFAEWIGGDARDRAAAALERHLGVVALLETIYLAARTNHPESPRKLYQVQGWPLPAS